MLLISVASQRVNFIDFRTLCNSTTLNIICILYSKCILYIEYNFSIVFTVVVLQILISCNCQPIQEKQQIQDTIKIQQYNPELQDTIINWEKIMNKNKDLMYCFIESMLIKHRTKNT